MSDGNGMYGFDRYTGDSRRAGAQVNGPLVRLFVEASTGSSEGEAMLTPAQARAMAARLTEAADQAEAASGFMNV
jgi:hypothetical protein